ncbi:hypothetical protein GCM10027280_41250 [Micromonospora polyrhachis]|uniref:Ribosomal protein S18 acetylase RimI-like enzyme n=1 Tax=Micromonospora polyrhachis TaxID=1282883 RepID=A0A7W7WN38_9ACTN|nr:GNAT family N-acetyltransferase [Micromonospora polyrhachis]MBB4956823.1 ribosomal protein S18 acetylase RimI-like enzyme [Micromonospora polyrhachis]
MPSVSPAKSADIPAIAALLEEMDRYYGVSKFAPIEDRQAEIKDHVFGSIPAINLLLAKDNNKTIGLASYSFLWPAVRLTRSLYLKELYVSKLHRRRGIGRLLMSSVAAIATETGCSRVEWTTDQDNEAAQRFYSHLEASHLSTKIFYRSDLHQST